MKSFNYILISILLLGCATGERISKEQDVSLSQNISISLASFKSIFPNRALIKQTLSFTRNGKSKDAQVIIKNLDTLSVTILSPFGIELMSLVFEDNSIKKVSGVPGIKIDFFQRAMADMLIIYSDVDKTRALLKGQGELKTSPLGRSIYVQGKEIISIKYSEAERWKSNIEYQQKELDYILKIKTVSIDYENIY